MLIPVSWQPTEECWGSNSHNQLGSRTIGVNIGDDEAPSAFGFLNIGEPVKQIAAGGDHTCALMETGKLKCWGRNDYGQLGLGNTTTLTTAIKLHPYVDVGEDVKFVSTGRNNTCAVTVSGQVKCWGLNDAGQLGQGNLATIGDDEAPSTISNISLATSLASSVSVGEKHVCALLEDKSVLCWGSAGSGRLGYANINTIGDNELPNSAGTVQGLSLDGIKYDEQDRLLSFGTKSFTYNANGDLLTETDSSTGITKTFDYDVFGNLKKVILPNKTINYKVDAQNRRVAKLEGSTVIEYYIWNENSQLIGVADSSGALISRFVYGSKAYSPDFMIKNGATYQLVTNHLGSLVAVVESNTGNIVQERSYDEFGLILSDSNPGFTQIGFAGCLFDPDTNLCRFGARDYDSSIGRWLSKDPILFYGKDANLYGYVKQDPINLIDPSGNCPWCLGALVGGAASAISAYAAGGSAKTILTSAIIGAIAGGASMGVSVFTTSATGVIAANAAIGGGANIATQVATGATLANIDLSSVAIGAIAGTVGTAAGMGAGTRAFFNTPVIGKNIGVAVANTRELWTSTVVGASIGTGVESGMNVCK